MDSYLQADILLNHSLNAGHRRNDVKLDVDSSHNISHLTNGHS